MRVKRSVIQVVLLAQLTSGCFASRSDLHVLLEQQKQLALRLSRMQDHLADLTLRIQGLRTDVREVKGDVVEVDYSRGSVVNELKALQRRVAQVEEKDQVASRVQAYQKERMQADLISLNSPDQMYETAVSSYAGGATDRALALFVELQHKWPRDSYAVGAAVKAGGIYANQGVYVEAIDSLLEVIENHPNSPWTPEAYLVLGRTLIDIDQDETGEQLLNDLVQFYSTSPETQPAYATLAELYAARIAATAPTMATETEIPVTEIAEFPVTDSVTSPVTDAATLPMTLPMTSAVTSSVASIPVTKPLTLPSTESVE